MRRERVEDLYDEYGARVLAFARRRTDPATAEEITVDVFVVAWRRTADVPDVEPLLWLYGVARRLLANAHRAQRRREALLTALKGIRPPATHDVREPGPLLEALAALGKADREVLMLSAWEDLDARQIAAVLGRSEPAVHQRLHRARQRLRAQLERRTPHHCAAAPKEATARD
ncbi:MAG TPA: sigma-70 family RNA polymerase sigma factor [Baekduia sp.]|uniref:RNA polymerase sigma factor n=1 Tax=Baekduia sp. TaxID=2600305 RepID=UPI002D76799C|nr:sigma-70 family RNA polymerase sigma factor [Baekduia sp.]HET6505711.1 sigma-70 family RNA polymerase sigma factor [Baekduia sp.]